MKQARQRNKHRIFAAFLCACMLFTMPGIQNVFPVVAAPGQEEGFQKENIITAFNPLAEDIKEQTVFTGTDLDELNLPRELTVSLLRESTEESEQESTEQENDEETDKIEENSDTETKDEQGTQAEKTDETNVTDSKDANTGESAPAEERRESETEQGKESSEEQQENAVLQETHTVTMQEYHAENVISVQTLESTQTEKQEETVTIDGVTWQSEPEYDGSAEGIYTFTAVLPGGYTLAEGVNLPQITVTVKESESGTDFTIQTLFDRIAALPDAEEYLATEPDMEDAYAEWEEKLYEYAEEAYAIWEEYKTLTEEQQAQISEEELAKLEAWMEIAETLSDHAVMLADNSEHHAGWTALSSSDKELTGGNYYLAGPVSMGTITIKGDVTLCLNGQTLTHSGDTGSVIVVESGTFTLCDCQDHWDYTSSFNEDTKTYSCEMIGTGGCITGGKGTETAKATACGGGILVKSGATFNMESGAIRENLLGVGTSSVGGGVFVEGIFNMSGGFIEGNSANNSGGVCINRGGTGTISGDAVIMENTATLYGGVCIDGELNMLGGRILGNEAGQTAGVGISDNGKYVMQNGLIEGNISTNGGVMASGLNILGTAELSGGQLRYNRSIVSQDLFIPWGCGGAKLYTSGILQISGDIEVSDNYVNDFINNLYIGTNKTFTITGSLSKFIGITTQATPTQLTPVEIASGSNHTITDADGSCFFSDKEGYKIVREENKLLLYPLSTCDLSGLDLTAEEAKLEPNFRADITTYEATVGNEVGTVGITATLAGSINGRTIELKNGDDSQAITMTSGTKEDVPLAVGLNKIEITVTSGSDTKTYTLNITREAPAGNPVTITTNKDGVEWTENPPTYKLTSDNGTNFVTNLTAVPDGTYHIYYEDGSDKNIDTGVEVKVEGAAATATVNYYTITFYDGDDELPTTTQQIVPAGATASAPTDNPTKTGYTFNKWVTKTADGDSTEYGFNEAVTEKTSVYASWSANTYTVSYDGNGSTGGSTANSTHTYGTAKVLTANGFTRSCTVTFNLNYTGSSSTDKTAAYTFAGWNTEADGSGTSYDDKASVKNLTGTNNGTVTLYAQWTPTSVTYTPTRAGYTFAGWYTDASCSDSRADSDGTYTANGNMTLYAKWAPESYTVTLNTNEGAGGTSLTSYTCGMVITLPTDWTKTGYTFAGWYDNEDYRGNPVTEISATDTGDKTFWAKWTPKTYQVTFYYHGADGGDATASQNVTYNSKYGILPVPSRTGYTFQGWYTEENGQGSKVTADTIVKTADAHTLHAYWKDETAPDQPVLQNGVTLPADWTNNQTTIPLKLYDGVGVTSLLVSVDGLSYTEVRGFSSGTGSMTYDYPSVQEGEHKYQFKAVDAAGNYAESDIFTVKLDQTKPVIGTLTYDNAVHLNFWHWIIGKKSIVIHVPVTDVGSGVTEISYTRTDKDAAGNLITSSAVTDTATVTNGEAKITIAADFRGIIAISCTDAAGNAADGVTIGKDAGGMIVEDNAPDITILADRNISDTQTTQPSGVAVSEGYYNSAPALFVTVKDDTGNAITAGLASVTYQVDGGEEKSVTVDTNVLQEEVTFTIPATEIAAGSTQIKVIIKATDNAGNTADRDITINVKGPEKQPAAVIDYRQEELTGLVPCGSYTIDGTETTADQEGHIAIKENWLGGSISIVKKGNGSETSDSPAQILSVPARPAAPNAPELSARTENSITLKPITGAQYRRTDGTGNWQDSTVFDGLNPKTPYTFVAYYPATDTSFASKESGETEIGTMPTPPTPDKLGIDYEYETLTPASDIEAFSDQSCTTPVAAGSAEDYMGTTVYIRYQADGIIPASATTAVSVPERTPTPTPGTIDATYPKAADGKLTGLTAGGSYMLSSDGGNTWESRTANESGEITGLKAGTYELYVAAGSTNFRSETATVTVGAKPATPYDKPAIQIDYDNRTLTGFDVDGTYLINGEEVSVRQDGSIEIDAGWFGNQPSIVRKGNEKDKLDSAAQLLFIPTIPPKPTPSGVDVSIAGGTGKLTGLTAGTVYEISTDGGKTWISSETANGKGEITGLAPGTYVVRVKVGVSNFASEPSESATIGAYKVTVTFMANGEKYTEVSVDYGGTLTDIPAVPPKKDAGDQTYAGEWCSDEQGTIAVFTNITADMTVYAVYTTAYTVTLQSGTGYTLSAINDSKSPVKEGGSFTFRFILQEGYHCITGSFAVMVGEDEVELTDGTYTITDIRRDLTVRVEGVDKDADNPPSGGGDNGDDDDDDSGDSKPTPTPTPPQTPPTDTQPTTPTTPPGTTPPVTENEPEGRKPETTQEPRETPGSEEPENNETQPPAETSQPQIPDTTPGSLTYSVGKGAVIVTLNNVDETVCAARVADASAVAQAVLSEEELAEVKQGQIIEIRIDVERLDIVPENDAEVIEKGIEDCQEQIPGLVMGMYVDISMYMRIGSGDWNAIHATNKPVEIILDVPGELAELTADFYIMRAHEGEYLLMEDLDETQETITIQTEAFSTYAILYQMQEDAGEKSAAKCGLCHICPTFLGICYFIWLAIIIVLALVIYLIIRRKRKEEENEEQ